MKVAKETIVSRTGNYAVLKITHDALGYLYFNMADGIDGDLDSTVASVLSLAEKSNKEKYRSIEVTKDVEPDLDIGNLLATDLQPVDGQEFR